jgi:hypothetical protein
MKHLLLLTILFGLVAGAALPARAQVVVYRFDFKKEGSAINYSFYDECWVIAPATGGSASWALTFRDGAHRRYVKVTDFGSLFFPNDGKQVLGVVSAAATSGTPQTTFLATGELAESVKGANVSARVPQAMQGYALSADDESMLPFDSTEGNVGYVGISTMKGSLQSERSADANSKGWTVEDTLNDLIQYLERRGFTEYEIQPEADGEAAAAADRGTGTGG